MAVAILIVLAATLLRLAFFPSLGMRVAFITFFPALMLAALYGGLRAGLLATCLSAVIADYFWMEPAGSLIMTNSVDWLALALFGASGCLVSGIAEAMHRANARALQAELIQRHELEHQIAERTADLTKEIAERDQIEAQLRAGEERLRLLTDNLPDSAVYQYAHEADGNVRFLYVSQGIESLNGVSAKDVLRDPQTLHGQILPEYLERVVEAEKSSSTDLSDFDMEVPMRRTDGQVRWMRLHSRPTRVPGGRTIWHGVQIDITERKRAGEALKQSFQQIDTLFDLLPGYAYFKGIVPSRVEIRSAGVTV